MTACDFYNFYESCIVIFALLSIKMARSLTMFYNYYCSSHVYVNIPINNIIFVCILSLFGRAAELVRTAVGLAS